METDPFGRRPRGRWQRALIYFGLAADPDAEDEASPGARPADVPQKAPDPETGAPAPRAKEQSWQRSALLYFGLVEGDPPSRYGAEVASELDDDIDELRRRVADLEAELRRSRRG